MRRLLVTGVHGFVGRTLLAMTADEPALRGWTVVDIPERFEILDASETERLVASAAPDAVIHLAAQSFVADSFRDPDATLRVNLLGTLNLLRAVRTACRESPLLFVSSGDVYGKVPDEALPIRESWPAEPRNPYAVSKLAAELLCAQWAATESMRIVIARPFNHIGPGQREQFAVSSFARQVAAIRRGERPAVVEVGDIDVTRDFTDVRDIVRAYIALLEQGAAGERYNVCSGTETSLRTLLGRLLQIADVSADIRQDLSRLRPAEQRRACGDPAKIRGATGWRATTPLDHSLRAMLEHWDRQDQR